MNGLHLYWRCWFNTLLLFFILNNYLHAQEENRIDAFNVVGNINAHIMPGEKVRVLVTASAAGTGTLQLRARGFRPQFLSGWDSKSVVCAGTCQVVDTLFFEPSRNDYGEYSFRVVAEYFIDDELIEQKNRRVRIKVTPIMIPEPPFNIGTINQLCWQPFESNLDYELAKVFYVNQKKHSGIAMNRSATSFDSCDIEEKLPERKRIGYYIQARDPGTGMELRSDVIYSIQDQTPPPTAEVISFSVRKNGNIELIWKYLPDNVSYNDHYILYRKQVNVGGVFNPVDTIRVFPVEVTAPVNYYPVLAISGQSVYTDVQDSLINVKVGNKFEISHLPTELQGSALVKTAIRDRWNESDTALVLNLNTESDIYIAYDVDVRNISQPDWLNRQFAQIGKSIDITDGKLRLFRSLNSFPAGKVELGGNYAVGTRLRNKEPLMYIVFVKPVNEKLPFAAGEFVQYVDELGVENDLNTYKYRITTIDAVGNNSTGPESSPIVIDLNAKCRPEITSWFTYENAGGTKFGKGLLNEICIIDPRQDANCLGFRDSDSLRFQAVRETISLFDSVDSKGVDSTTFDSGWQNISELSPPFCYRFKLLSEQGDQNFVNGKTYYYRVRAKDIHGNVSAWSETLAAIQDAFPPDDVNALTATSERFADGEQGCNQLTWSGADDLVSGVKSYIVYRTDQGNPGNFMAVDTIPGNQNSYCDTVSNFASNKIVVYKIGSIDNVGNVRTADESTREVTIRVLKGPKISADSSQVITCSAGRTRIVSNSITISWDEFDNTDVTGYEARVQQPNGTVIKKLFFEPALTKFSSPLDAGDGVYKIRIRAFYANRDTTIFSNTLSVRKKQHLAGVRELVAKHDSRPTGNILLNWSHPELDEIEVVEIFTWTEGVERPVEPRVTLSGAQTEWVHDFVKDSLVAYQCNNYAVRVRDCFGLVSDTDTIAVEYSNKPPVFIPDSTKINADSIMVFWSRPFPRVKQDDSFDATMVVYRDSVTSPPIDSLNFLNKNFYVLHNPIPDHNYIFKVKELILDDLGSGCSTQIESGFSQTLFVPFDNRPAPVDFEVQALPVHPDSVKGKVFVAWQQYNDPAVTYFILQYSSLDAGQTDNGLFDVRADTFLVKNLDINLGYKFEVIAVDSLGQHSDSVLQKQAHFSPQWLFTPKITSVAPACFRDSLTVFWAWVDKDRAMLPNNFGADSIFLEVSIDPGFVFKKSLQRLTATQSHKLSRDNDFNFVNDQDDRLYLRIRAKDRWGHLSPWSSIYAELGVATGEYDEIPPQIVESFIDSVKAPLFGSPDEVNVYMHWPEVTDNCSGTAFYEVVRNDSTIIKVAAGDSIHQLIDRNLQPGESLLSTTWRIFPVDKAGNRRLVATVNSIPLTITAPDSGWCENDTTFCWDKALSSIPGFEAEYYVEGARFPSLLGNPVTNITSGPTTSQCINFNKPWEGIYWRIKARVGNFESAWSDTFFCKLRNSGMVSSLSFSQSLPEYFALKQNYPNPFNPSTVIKYDIPYFVNTAPQVVLEIFNVKGQKIITLVNKKQSPGEYEVEWDGRNSDGKLISSGVYVYRIQADKFVSSYKMTFLK